MKKTALVAIVFGLAAGLAPAPAPAADVHALLTSSRTFRESTRTTTEEYWIAADKRLLKTDSYLAITRRDLGVLWGVIRRANTYMEEKPAPARAPASREDIHTVGYDFGPGPVAWTLEPATGTKTIAGIVCEHLVGRGRSDVAEITVDLWVAPAAQTGGPELLKAMVESIRADPRRSEIGDLLDKLGGRVPLEREETIDGPIGPVMKYGIKVSKLETAEPPAGTYDLPPGAKKETPDAPAASQPAAPAFVLPAAAAVELKRLDETYRVLDAAAAAVWTGWSNYREHPFLFGFENGLKVLVGHPNPPRGFELLPGVAAGGRNVYVDRSQMSSLEIRQPLSCGGGIGALGEVGGRPVTVIDMKFTKIPSDPSLKDKPFPGRADDPHPRPRAVPSVPADRRRARLRQLVLQRRRELQSLFGRRRAGLGCRLPRGRCGEGPPDPQGFSAGPRAQAQEHDQAAGRRGIQRRRPGRHGSLFRSPDPGGSPRRIPAGIELRRRSVLWRVPGRRRAAESLHGPAQGVDRGYLRHQRQVLHLRLFPSPAAAAAFPGLAGAVRPGSPMPR